MLTLSLLLLQSVATPTSGRVEASDASIVVNGSSLDATRQAVERCFAEQCPPDREMRATLRYANQQFLAGQYDAARRTIGRSRHRNNRYAKRYPELVSDLTRADVTLSTMVGRPQFAFSASLDAVSALKSGLPVVDPKIMMQRLELGDQFARQGRLEAAAEIYDEVAKQGRDINNYAVEGHALYRSAVLFSTVASVNSLYRYRARRAVARLADRPEPEFAPFRDGLVLLESRLKVLSAKPSQRAAALASVPKTGLTEPVLLSEPFVDFNRPGLSTTGTASTGAEWADVSFWVKPDGTVDDVQVEQTSSVPPGGWLPLKLRAVADRRYAPIQQSDGPGVYRVERFSMVYNMVRPTGALVPIRSSHGRLLTTSLSSSYQAKKVPVQ